MVLPIIETAPVFASPVVLASQRTLVAPQTQLRAAVLRSDDVCASQERLERLEQKVSDIADSFDDLKEVVLQQARILDEISKRLPKP
jgi:t-SNARE complex subunit (syntaxin)